MCKRTNPASSAGTKARAPLGDNKKKSIATTGSFAGCGVDRSCPMSVTSHTGHEVRLDQYQSPVIRGSKTTSGLDHEFVWYDLDAIRGKAGTKSTSCVVLEGHDFRAGLLFTTEGQVLSNEAETNTVVTQTTDTSRSSSTRQLLESDVFVWPTFSLHNSVEESREDRDFREQLEELEDELYFGDDFSSVTTSSFYW